MQQRGLHLLAFDLGAESGRAILGRFDGEQLGLDIIRRFPNRPVTVGGTTYWNVLGLFQEMKEGLAQAVHHTGSGLESMAVDTWGVDFGLLDINGLLLSNPVHYRDPHTEGIMEEAFKILPKEQLFARTGNQFMRFNTLFQLLALTKGNSSSLAVAKTLLLMPNLFDFFFTGRRVTEATIASTTQMLDPHTGNWDDDLLKLFEIETGLLTEIVAPGTIIGPVSELVTRELGIGSKNMPVIAPASHDTGSAIAAVPASGENHIYISSGTWSLMGMEVQEPIITKKSLTYNFTNEGGVGGRYRFLKNIMGLWLIQQCKRSFEREGRTYTYDDLTAMAQDAQPFGMFVDPDADDFLNPLDMPTAIREFCRRTQQPIPKDAGTLIRCCLESLALKYRWTAERLEEITDRRVEVIHIVGGGIQNELLCQFTADAVGLPVLTGPREATAIGNILMQLMALNKIDSIQEGRQIVRNSFPVKVYEPKHKGAWDDAYGGFCQLLVEG